ncbi:alpha amylase, catalytic domain protein [Bifidobacterium gallicum DSM 20093 = LMG 11596]|nr:alpha amylase, catalytic domain protein [Bifidobacterium gallicum DSM 20093 = LMG 11596]
MRKKAIAGLLAVATMGAGLAVSVSQPEAAQAATRDSYSDTIGNPSFEAARNKYGLTKNMRDGSTLHTFMWSFKTITEHMPEIAQAGYTSIQTNNVSAVKDNSELGKGNWYLNWYYIYQPTDTTVGNYILGTAEEFKTMCDTAHQYGVRVIVDAVANHFTSDFDVIEPAWQDKSLFHVNKGNISDYNDREDCTQNQLSGLWDLNTQSKEVENRMADFYKQVVALGADGFRYDAAKHIELPGEFGGSTYWTGILNNGSQYQYGEVLQDKNVREVDYANMFSQSSIGGGGVTGSDYGQEMRNSMNDRSLSARFFSDYRMGTSPDKIVTWIESHDNYCDRQSEKFTEEQVRGAYATMNARGETMTLFFNRPYASGGTQPWFSEKSKIGDVGADDWKQPGIVASNHFRNAMVGNDMNTVNCGGDQCVMVERYKKNGSSADDGLLVATTERGGSSINGMSTKLDDGVYTDEVSGAKLTVSGGKISATEIGPNTVAAFYNAKVDTTPISSATAAPNQGVIEDTKSVTLRSFNMANASYSTSEGASGSFKDGDIIEIGGSTGSGGTVTVTVSGTGNNGKQVNKTFTYTKETVTPVDTLTISGDGVSNNTLTIDLASATSAQLEATYTPANATVKKVTWTSSDPTVATVSSTGAVEAIKAGSTTISVTAGDKTTSISVRVTGDIPVDQMTTIYYPSSTYGKDSTYIHYRVGDGAWTVAPGEKMSEACDGWVSKRITTGGKAVTFDFNNGAGAWDNNGGKDYTGKGTTLVVEKGQIGVTVPCKTTPDPVVVPVSSVSIAGGDFSLTEGASKQLSATVAPSNATDKVVSWKSSNATVATVDASGNVTAKKAGTATITATAGGKSSSVTVTVSAASVDVPVESVLVSPSSLVLRRGESGQLSASVAPSDASDKSVVWYSSNPAVASVDASGKVTALKAGVAAITASAGGVVSSAVSVTVTDTVVPVTGITVDDPADGKLGLQEGASKVIRTTVTPWNASDPTVVYSSTDPTVVKVSADGMVTGVKAGTAYVLVSASGFAQVVEVTVSPRKTVFTDVPVSAWQASDIQWLADNAISMGNGDGTFGFGKSLNRRDMAIFLYRLAKLNGDASAASFKPSAADYARFSDVKQGSFGAAEVLWLASKGVIKGFEDGSFRGDKSLNRQDSAIYLYRFAKVMGDASASSFKPSAADYARFSDVKQGSFGATEILWLTSVGIVKGNTDGTFRGGNNLTREDMAVFLHRTHNHLNK